MYKSTNSELLSISYLVAVAFTLVLLKRVWICAGEGGWSTLEIQNCRLFYLRVIAFDGQKNYLIIIFWKNQYFNT